MKMDISLETGIELVQDNNWESYLDIVVSDHDGYPEDFETVDDKFAFLITDKSLSVEEIVSKVEGYFDLYENSSEVGADEV